MTAPDTPISSPPGMNITEKNKLKGSLFIEAYGSLIDGISKDAESEAEKALDITFNAIGAASATVMLAIDPLGSLIGAGIGWLIEHVSFLRDALNQLMGNPEEIQANVEATKAQAAELRVLAEDHKNGLATFDGWTGQSSERFKTSMDGMSQELDELASAVETKAKIVAIMGMLVTVLRDIVRDLIAQLLGSLIGGAILAAAAMIPTFGASIPAFIGFAVGKAVALGVNIASRVARVVAALGRQMKRIGDLDDIMAKISKGWNRFENSADVAEITYEGVKASNGVDKTIDEAVAKNNQAGQAGQGGGSTAAQGAEALAETRVGTTVQAPMARTMMDSAEPMQAAGPVGCHSRCRPMPAWTAQPMQAVSRTQMEAAPRPIAGRLRTDAHDGCRAGCGTDAFNAAERPTAPTQFSVAERATAPTHFIAAERATAPTPFNVAEQPMAPTHFTATERATATHFNAVEQPSRTDAAQPLQPTTAYERTVRPSE